VSYRGREALHSRNGVFLVSSRYPLRIVRMVVFAYSAGLDLCLIPMVIAVTLCHLAILNVEMLCQENED
jgi:hypothetical protein